MSDKKHTYLLSIISAFLVLVIVISSIVVFTKRNPKAKEISTNNLENTVYKKEEIIKTNKAETYSSLFYSLCKLKNAYPQLIQQASLGKSEMGKDIPMILLGTGSKKALVTAGIHAREHLTVKYMLKCIEDYCDAYYSPSNLLGSFNIKELLNEYTLYIIPCINPDGMQIVLSLDEIKENVKVEELSDYKANYNGVDLNRNFPLGWDNIDNGVYEPSASFFKGFKPASEKETRLLMELCENNSFDFLLSFHVKGNCIFWGDTYNTKNNLKYFRFANDIAKASFFRMTEPTKKPESYGGGFENWFRHKYKKCGLCVELTEIKNTIEPCGNNNYKDFNSFVNYDYSRLAIAAAMASKNK